MKYLQLNIHQSKYYFYILILFELLCILNNRTNVVSVGVQNRSNISQKVILDFSKAKNLLFSTKTAKVEKIIPPGQYDFFMHFYLLSDDTGKNNDNLNYNMIITPIK